MTDGPDVREFLQFRVRPWSLVAATGAVACLATVAGFFGRFWWVLDLAAHFRVQYLLFLASLALCLAFARRFRVSAALAGFAAVNLVLVAPLYLGKPAVPTDETQALRAVLINVNTANTQYERVTDFLSETDADFVVIEEINATWLEQLRELRTSYPHVEAHAREDNFGIALFSKHPFVQSGALYIGDTGVPSVFGQCEVGGKRLFVLGTHPLPPTGAGYSQARNNQLAEIPRFLESVSCPILLLGDLNVTPWCRSFRKLLRDTSLKDSAKGWGVQPTWPTFFFPLRIPIDHCLLSPELTVTSRRVGPYLGSDHYPVIIDIVF